MPHSVRYHPRREYRTEPSEDSDIVVALFRSAVVIAFTVLVVRQPTYAMRSWTWLVVVAAAGYTLTLMFAYLAARRWLTTRRRAALASSPLWRPLLDHRIAVQRIVALAIDLCLVSAIIVDVGAYGREYLDLYYVVVAVGAIWFHRAGGILTALFAAGCVAAVTLGLEGLTGMGDWVVRVQFTTRAAILLTVGVVTGYLARARDAERRERERTDFELNMARRVQREMLPHGLPSLPGYDLGVRFEPAGAVGGDYYDVMLAPDGRLVVVLADVAGRSVYAVLHLSLIRSHIRQAVRDGLTPVEMAHRLNDTLLEALPPEGFVGLFHAAISPLTGRVSYVNCGHAPPVIVRAAGEPAMETLFTGNIVLGVDETAVYAEGKAQLAEGDLLVCATDGVTEALNERYEMFDAEGMARAAAAARGGGADEVAEKVMAAARAHGVGRPVDDATLVVLRRLGPD